MLSNPVPGPPASVLAAVLREDPQNPPQPGDRHRATFATVFFPDLPSLMSEVVALPQYALLDANVEVTGILVSNGWATQAVVTATSAYTPPPNVAVVLCDATSAGFTLTLPDATQPGFSVGQRYTVIKTDSTGHSVTIAASGGQLIGGASTVTLTTANAQTGVVFDGANWWVWAGTGTSGGPPTGAAGGALAGTYPNPSLSLPITGSGSTSSFGGLLSLTQTNTPLATSPVGFVGAASTDAAFGMRASGDSTSRFKWAVDGTHQWGPGTAAADVQMSRTSAGVLTVQPVTGGSAATLAVTATGSAAAILSVANLGSTPAAAALQLTAAVAGDRIYGLMVAGDGFQRMRADSTGKLQWGTGAATQDTSLYRAGVGVLQTDGTLNAVTALQIGGVAVGALDPTAADIQPIGARAAGATGESADAGHVHQANVSLNLFGAPSGATAETIPRSNGLTGTSSTLTSGTFYAMLIPLAKGTVVANLSFCTRGTALSGTLQHGWFALTDSSMIVRAVTGDQTGTFLATANTHLTLPVAASYTVPTTNYYYVGVCGVINGGGTTGMPLMLVGPTLPADLASLAPAVCGVSSVSQTTPPVAGSTLTTITASNGYNFYAFTS